MFSSIRRKIIFMYSFLILIPLIIINYMAIENTTRSTFRDIEVNSLKTANIISSISRDNINNIVNLKRIVKQYAPNLNGRIVVLDEGQRVIADSFHALEDEVLSNNEIKGALNLEEKHGYYIKNGVNILQVAVPISTISGGNRKVIGVVLVSVNIDDAIDYVKNFRIRLISISVIAATIGIIVSALASNEISRPIVTLSSVARKIAKGKLGETVSIKGKDEIGVLAENFNFMSKELYRIDKGRNQFVGDVSHELRTPLASMKALIDSLLYGEDDIEVYREYLKDMDSEIDRLSNLVQNLLNLSKIKEKGIKKDSCSLKDLVEDSVKVLRPLIQTSNIDVHIDLKNSPIILCDPEMIKEVFINLGDNALKYMDTSKEQGYIDFIGRQHEQYYLLSIEDNGIGIDQKDLDSIFEKFYRADTSRSRDTGGAGIGLSIVDSILKEHEWKVEVESKLGQGTAFRIKIPNKFLLDS